MLKVFLVEDEAFIRESLRDNIPWAQEGYTVVGESADGELALPLIRKTRPDVLITDIKMPFMDELTLSRLVSREIPNIKIVIISGYDEFDYARQAIEIGVEQYLLKPITKTKMLKILREMKEKINTEWEQQNYLEQFRREAQEYEQFARRQFFERLVGGEMDIVQCYEQAEKLDLELHAQSYNIVLFSIQPPQDEHYSEQSTQVQEELMQFFLRYPDYLLFRWNLQTYAVLVKGSAEQIEPLSQRCLQEIEQEYARSGGDLDWHAAAGEPTSRLSQLPSLFRSLERIWAYRWLAPQLHILTAENTRTLAPDGGSEGLGEVDVSKVDPAIIRGVLQSAAAEEIPKFAEEYLSSVREGLKSRLFCQYLLLNIRFTADAFAQPLGGLPAAVKRQTEAMITAESSCTYDGLLQYMEYVLSETVRLRDNASQNENHGLIQQAVAYIDANFTRDSLTLGEVSRMINISTNYFSAIFSQEMRMTFTEYLTGKRMELARQLLRNTDKRSGEVAFAVGYKDPHYFSFLFHKTQGCTPRDYRAGGKE